MTFATIVHKWQMQMAMKKMKATRRMFIGGTAAFGTLAMRALSAKHAFEDTTSWDPFVPNITDEATCLRRKFR